jgi:hypothetical protein
MPATPISGRRAASLLALLAAAVALLMTAAASPARAAAAPALVVQDDATFLHGDDASVKAAMDQARDLGFTHVRLTAGWSLIAPGADSATRPDFDATDPAQYPAPAWAQLDRAVRLAVADGLTPMIDIAFWAPRWATQDAAGTPGGRLRTEIDPGAYAQFAQAVATRYRGDWTPPAAPSAPAAAAQPNVLERLLGRTAAGPATAPAPQPDPLPAVTLYTLWNEPNHQGFLMPQWVRRDGAWVPRSAEIYRAMVRAAYPAVKAAAPAARVLIGGTASMGSSTPGRSGVPPLRFLRALTCVDARYRPVTTGDCAGYTTLPGDGWAHHPYSLHTLPDRDAADHDKVPVAGMPRLARALARLVAAHRLAPADRDIYVTEYGYETGPGADFGLRDQGRLLAWAQEIATRTPHLRMWAQFLLRDVPGQPSDALLRATGAWHSGLMLADGTPKPALAAWKAPVFARCVRAGGRRLTMVWGTLHASRTPSVAVVQAGSRAHWRAVASSASRSRRAHTARTAAVAAPGAGIRRYLPYRHGRSYRLRWGGAGATTTAAVTPAGCPPRHR